MYTAPEVCVQLHSIFGMLGGDPCQDPAMVVSMAYESYLLLSCDVFE